MAIRKHGCREPFLDRESAIKALKDLTEGDRIPRRAMYLLQIINSHIQDGKRIFERIPQEVFSGLPGGGRRNVQAAALCRAQGAPDGGEQAEVLESGYTREQQVIGLWAERDGCWSDLPEADQLRKGRTHRSEYDGSEARIFFDGGAKVHKTIDFVRYNCIARFLDRVAIHNALFPEARMTIEGWGVRDYADDNTGFCAVVSQPFIKGTTPTQEQIDRSMYDRGLVIPERSGGFFYETPSRQVLVTDVHDNNCVLTPQGRIVVFDCEAMVNDINGFGGRYTIPPLQYSDDSVGEIHEAIGAITPASFPSRTILNTVPKEQREEMRRLIEEQDGTAGPLPDGQFKDYIVQKDPVRKDWWTVVTPRQLEMYFRLHDPKLDDGTSLTDKEKRHILRGEPFKRGNDIFVFNLDKGRAEQRSISQIKLRQTVTKNRQTGLSV